MKQVNYSACQTMQEIANTTIDGLSEVYHYAFPEYIRQLPKYLEKCTSYRELGTNQGGSASVAVLSKLSYYELVDKSFSNFRPIKNLFDAYTAENNIEICYQEMSSLDVNTDFRTDFLLVDSVHKYKHVSKEIQKYESLTNKYMMFHDTYGFPEVGKAVTDFLKTTTKWKLIEEQQETPGYMVLERIE